MIFENLNLFFKQLSSSTEQKIARILFNNSMTISVAESCTGGLISSRLTDIAGSSSYIKENYITYSNEAKIKLLGVSEKTLTEFGAVSEQCAVEMAQGVFDRTDCDIALSITGVAGPDHSEEKPPGLFYVAIKSKYATSVKKIELDPKTNRKVLKFMFSQLALEYLSEFLTNKINKATKN